MSAPVCHINPNQPIDRTRTKQMQILQTSGSTPTLPSIPKATDLPSVIRAVTQITNIVNQLTGAATPVSGGNVNSRSSGGDAGAAGTNGKAGQAGDSGAKNNKKARWVEVNRAKEVVRVYNEQDKGQYVDVERINSLTMQDTVTGSTWEWKR